MKSAHRSARLPLQSRAALLVCAFALGNLGALAHETTVSHTRCPEHGELVHEAVLADSTSPVGHGVTVRELPVAASHQHDHCFVACAPSERTTAAQGTFLVATPVGRLAAVEVSSPDAAPRALAAVYRTAPKTSPPVA